MKWKQVNPKYWVGVNAADIVANLDSSLTSSSWGRKNKAGGWSHMFGTQNDLRWDRNGVLSILWDAVINLTEVLIG